MIFTGVLTERERGQTACSAISVLVLSRG